MADNNSEKKSSGAGKFFLGAALGAIAGAIAGHFVSKAKQGDCDGCDCGDDCDCEECAEKGEKKPAIECDITIEAGRKAKENDSVKEVEKAAAKATEKVEKAEKPAEKAEKPAAKTTE